MATQINEPAEPIAKGIIPTAKQAFRDLFVWKQRVEVINEYGESRTEWQSPPAFANPFAPITQLSFRAWIFFFTGFIAWMADAYDFHALSIQTTKLAKYFNTTNTKISEAITLTLLLRSVGAAFFGVAGDKFGRKWPMVINMFVLGMLNSADITTQTVLTVSQACFKSDPSMLVPSSSFSLSVLFLESSWVEVREHVMINILPL